MANQEHEDFISHFVTGPFNPDTQNHTERYINLINGSYTTYIIDFETESGVIMLPISFANDFNDEIDDYAVLMDNNHNSFEVKIDRLAGCIVLTTGCGALRDFYNTNTAAWITMDYMGLGHFQIKKITSKSSEQVVVPLYDPPVTFELDRNIEHGAIFQGFCDSINQLSYRHNPNNFSIYYEKMLRNSDIHSGFLTLGSSDFRNQCLKKRNVDLTLIDDNGNKWICKIVVPSLTQANWRIAGQWKTMIEACNIKHNSYMIIGAPGPEFVSTAFISFKQDPS